MNVVMPQLGESIVEATLVKWRVKENENVTRGQILAEVETDKATNEIPAPKDGTVEKLLIQEGQTVPVGTPILRYLSAQTKAEAPPPKTAPKTSEKTEAQTSGGRLAPRPSDSFASPAVRRLARKMNLDLEGIRGSGRQGRLTRDDLLSGKIAPASPPKAMKVYKPPAVEISPGDRTIPFSRRRTYIAEHMSYSLNAAAHVAAVVEIDMSAVLRAKEEDRRIAERQNVRITPVSYVVQSIGRALGATPELNAHAKEDALILKAEKNIGVAVDTDEGLIVPVIKRVDELTILGIARNLQELAERARKNELSAEDLSGGTFTISNPGRDGNLFGISIIRQPEVAIFRMGEIKKRAVVKEIDGEDAIVVRPIMYAALSYDHRVIDGKKANGFLKDVRELLESTRGSLETQRPTKT